MSIREPPAAPLSRRRKDTASAPLQHPLVIPRHQFDFLVGQLAGDGARSAGAARYRAASSALSTGIDAGERSVTFSPSIVRVARAWMASEAPPAISSIAPGSMCARSKGHDQQW